jgi:hypothetical protein
MDFNRWALSALGALGCLQVGGLAFAQTLQVAPLENVRLRYDMVDQDGSSHDATALTLRARLGVQASYGDWTALAEMQGVAPLTDTYNDTQNGRTTYPTVRDPKNIELDRLQLSYAGLSGTLVTVGQQRILLDDQRFVGNSDWRQTEVLYDALRVQNQSIANLKLDLAYSWRQQTQFGTYGQGAFPAAVGGNFAFLNGAYTTPLGIFTGFGYLADEHYGPYKAKSTQTYGGRYANHWAVTRAVAAELSGSWATQSSWAANPLHYRADYYRVDAKLSGYGASVGVGREVLGADKGVAGTSFQTPFASLHPFQGWAERFLTDPPNGVQDNFGSAGYAWKAVGPIQNLSASVIYHSFDSDRLDQHYGHEWDGVIQARRGPYVVSLYGATYCADRFSTSGTEGWLALEWIPAEPG